MKRTESHAPELATAPSQADIDGNARSTPLQLPSVRQSKAPKRNKLTLATEKARQDKDARLQAQNAAIDAVRSPAIPSMVEGRPGSRAVDLPTRAIRARRQGE